MNRHGMNRLIDHGGRQTCRGESHANGMLDLNLARGRVRAIFRHVIRVPSVVRGIDQSTDFCHVKIRAKIGETIPGTTDFRGFCVVRIVNVCDQIPGRRNRAVMNARMVFPSCDSCRRLWVARQVGRSASAMDRLS